MWTMCRANAIFVCFTALGLVCLFGCSDSPTDPEDNGVSIPVDARLVLANTRFGFKLFEELVEQDAGKNVFISPSSIALALAMVYNGASGETQQAMADVLELQEMSLQEVNEANAALIANLENPSKHVDISIANSMWMREGTTFEPDFLKRNEDFYEAKIGSLDIADPGAPGIINDWVSEETHGKIDRIIDNIHPDAALTLLNAIYFQGSWTVKFDRGKTYRGTFTLLDGSTVSVPMMSQVENFEYAEGDGYQAVELPYRDSNVSMLFILPQAGRFEEIEGMFSAESVTAITKDLTPQQVRLFVPKFTFESEFNLSETLIQMGMPAAFGNADFSGMTGNRDLFISDVLHKAFVAVDEEGTEAAAATAVIMKLGAPMIEGAILMKLDRPYLFLVRDNDTGTILFIGRVLNPEA